MRCEDCRTLMSVPVELLETAPATTMWEHLEECSVCRNEFEVLDGVIARFKTLPRLVPPPVLLERLNARIDADLATRAESSPLRQGRATSTRRLQGSLLALAAALLLVLLAPQSAVRFKGEAALHLPLALDIQVSVERTGHGHPRLERAEDGMILYQGDGLLFHFEVAGGAQLLLIERDPRNRLRVVFERSDLAQHPGGSSLDIANVNGKPLSYLPDGPPGEYVWLAILSRDLQPVSPAQLEAYWDRYVDRLLDQHPPENESTLRMEAVRLQVASTGEDPPESKGGSAEGHP